MFVVKLALSLEIQGSFVFDLPCSIKTCKQLFGKQKVISIDCYFSLYYGEAAVHTGLSIVVHECEIKIDVSV